jgi:hypothetical protein
MDKLVEMFRTGTHELRATIIAHMGRRIVANRAAQQIALAEEHARNGGDGYKCYKHACQFCEKTFYATRWDARNCSNRCAMKIAHQRRDARRQAARKRICQQCTAIFTGRIDARFCGDNCRQKNHRNKRSDAPPLIRDTLGN